MSEMTAAFNVNAVVYQEGESWIAQVLEYDVVARADNLPSLHYELERVLAGYASAYAEEGLEPFQGLGPAPRRFWRMWETATLTVDAEELPFRASTPAANMAIIHKLKIAELAAVDH